MKPSFWILLVLPLAAVRGAEAPSAPPALTVAVLDFTASPGVARGTGPTMGDLVGAELSARPELVLVERTELKQLLQEQELGLSGAVTPDSAAHVGRLTGAKILVSGRIFRANGSMIVIAKVMGVETGRVFGEMVEADLDAPLTELAGELGRKIAATLADQGAVLAPPPPPADQRLEKLAAQCRGRRLPVLSVALGDLALLAQRCGFPLTDAPADRAADIVIGGRASHDFEMRKGRLVIDEARMEVTVREAATGNILAVDRQVSLGLDLSSALAADQARQAAALAIAERIFPLLARGTLPAAPTAGGSSN